MVTKEKLDEVLTNEQTLHALIDPPARSGRIRIVERPHLQPRRCAITGRFQDNFFIDLGIDTGDFMGQVYLCSDIAGEIAKISGFVPKEDYIASLELNQSLAADAIELLNRNTELESSLNELLNLRGESVDSELVERIRNLLDKVPSEIPDQHVIEFTREGTEPELRSSKSDDEQGMVNIFKFSGSGTPAV
jgi:hypothetical protein